MDITTTTMTITKMKTTSETSRGFCCHCGASVTLGAVMHGRSDRFYVLGHRCKNKPRAYRIQVDRYCRGVQPMIGMLVQPKQSSGSR